MKKKKSAEVFAFIYIPMTLHEGQGFKIVEFTDDHYNAVVACMKTLVAYMLRPKIKTHYATM